MLITPISILAHLRFGVKYFMRFSVRLIACLWSRLYNSSHCSAIKRSVLSTALRHFRSSCSGLISIFYIFCLYFILPKVFRDILYITYNMPLTEAQRRAQQKWREANREHINAAKKKWTKDNEDYRLKQIEYVKKYQRRKKAFMEEARRLSDIEIL